MGKVLPPPIFVYIILFYIILKSSAKCINLNLNLYSAIHRSLDKDSHSFTEYLTAINRNRVLMLAMDKIVIEVCTTIFLC